MFALQTLAWVMEVGFQMLPESGHQVLNLWRLLVGS